MLANRKTESTVEILRYDLSRTPSQLFGNSSAKKPKTLLSTGQLLKYSGVNRLGRRWW